MTFYAAVSGNDIIAYRLKLNATTLTGAKREAGKRLGHGFRDHTIHIGQLLDEGTRNERGQALSSRAVGGSQWRDEE